MLSFKTIMDAFERQESHGLTILYDQDFYYLRPDLVKYLDEVFDYEDITNNEKVLLTRVRQILKKKHYYLPSVNDFDEFKLALDFLYTLDKKDYDYLNGMVHDHGSFRHFKEGCLHLGVYEIWLTYKKEKLESFLTDWCDDKGINYL